MAIQRRDEVLLQKQVTLNRPLRWRHLAASLIEEVPQCEAAERLRIASSGFSAGMTRLVSVISAQLTDAFALSPYWPSGPYADRLLSPLA